MVEVLLSNLSKFAEEDFPENIFGNKYLTSSKEFLSTLKGKIKEEKKKRPKDDDDTNLEEARKEILGYFRKHGIESIRLKNNKLVIKYNFKEEEEEANTQELQQIQSYCQSKGINLLTLNDLKKGNNNQESGYGKLLFYGGIALAVGLVIGLIAYLAYRSEKNGPRRY